MTGSLDVIVLDDDPQICSLIVEILKSFYVWGDVHPFTGYNDALAFCKKKQPALDIFILDVFLGTKSAFDFLDEISSKYAWAAEDTIIITGKASDDVVNMCIASNINYLLEKPMKTYSLKLAVRAIVGKYTLFAKRLIGDPEFAKGISKL